MSNTKNKKIVSVHFVGIKGVGMTPLAVIAKEAGWMVTGSDVADIYITDEILQKAGINVFSGFAKGNIKNIDLIITTGAHGGYDNEEVLEAKKKHIPVMTQGEAVGYFMSGEPFERSDMEGISVAGCHGKTTTTAIIATLLTASQKDPSYVIGTGFIPSLGSSGHYGKGKYFIAEADEYATEPKYDKTPKFLWQHPRIGVVTNIEYDHPDLYPTFAALTEAYKTFIFQILDTGGKIIAFGDDPEIQKIIQHTKNDAITYGFDKQNTYVISSVTSVIGGTEFAIMYQKTKLGTLRIPVFGTHNALNALAASIVALRVGVSLKQIQESLLQFLGTKRRLEFIGQTSNGASVFDDYAHHPTEIKKTLASLRERYKQSNIICIFQPHTFSRTKLLFSEFCTSFTDANMVILTDIYASQREPFDSSITSQQLANKIGLKQTAVYLPKVSDVIQYLQEKNLGPDSILVTMGAGDVYQIAYALVKT